MHSDVPQRDEPPAKPELTASSMDFTSPYAPVMASDVTTGRPLGLTVISALCILGGIVGLLAGLMGVAQLLLAEVFANAFDASSGPIAEAQQEMQQQMQAVTRQFLVPNILTLVTTLIVGGCLLIGGIALLRNRLWASTLLRRTFLAAIVLEIAYAILQCFVQWQMFPIMQKYMSSIASGGDSPGGSEVMSQFATIGMVIGIGFVFIWAIAKISLMLWGRIYLNRPRVRGFLQS